MYSLSNYLLLSLIYPFLIQFSSIIEITLQIFYWCLRESCLVVKLRALILLERTPIRFLWRRGHVAAPFIWLNIWGVLIVAKISRDWNLLAGVFWAHICVEGLVRELWDLRSNINVLELLLKMFKSRPLLVSLSGWVVVWFSRIKSNPLTWVTLLVHRAPILLLLRKLNPIILSHLNVVFKCCCQARNASKLVT